MATTTKAPEKAFYSTDNGAIYCLNHLGYMAKAAVEAEPKARTWHTHGPQGYVEKMTPAEVEDFRKFLVEEMGETGDTLCEGCRGPRFPH